MSGNEPALPGLQRVGGVVVLTGPALRAALDCTLRAIIHRGIAGLPNGTFEVLACELRDAMAATGQSDVRISTVGEHHPMERPTVPITEASDRLGVSTRQCRRLAPRLGGRRIGGRWLIDELALREHIEGTQP